MRPIDLLLPELFASDGGIQRYSFTLIKALRVIRPETPLRFSFRMTILIRCQLGVGLGLVSGKWFPKARLGY